MRSSTGRVFQVGKAAFAAATALSTSSFVPIATVAILNRPSGTKQILHRSTVTLRRRFCHI